MANPVSPLAPKSFPDLPEIPGVKFATAAAGIKYEGRTDVLLAVFDAGTSVAGVLTQSQCASAAVDWCRAGLASGQARALVVNSGNANAFTGMKGQQAVERTAELASAAVGCATSDVFLASTGVIGEALDAEKFQTVLGDCAQNLHGQPWEDAARAIMTTDTFPKLASASAEIDGVGISLVGIAKGSGMIAPDMATMLSFIFTDAPVAVPVLQALLAQHVDTSFNAITVDSDTSTSDTVLVFATGKAEARGVKPITSIDDPRALVFGEALRAILFDLAMQVVRDGEGASKLVTISVDGAVSDASAKIVAMSVANSPLVKTAIAGADANWGRVVMAVGKAGEPADRDKLSIRFGDLMMAKDGLVADDHDEDLASAYMQGDEIEISISLGLGDGTARAYTCDLTHGYISINADYRS